MGIPFLPNISGYKAQVILTASSLRPFLWHVCWMSNHVVIGMPFCADDCEKDLKKKEKKKKEKPM